MWLSHGVGGLRRPWSPGKYGTLWRFLVDVGIKANQECHRGYSCMEFDLGDLECLIKLWDSVVIVDTTPCGIPQGRLQASKNDLIFTWHSWLVRSVHLVLKWKYLRKYGKKTEGIEVLKLDFLYQSHVKLMFYLCSPWWLIWRDKARSDLWAPTSLCSAHRIYWFQMLRSCWNRH